MAIARWQIFSVWGALICSRADTTNDADSTLSFKKYCEKPPLLTSNSTSQIAEKTFCGKDWSETSSFPTFVKSLSLKSVES